MKELDKKELDSVNGGRRGKYSAEEYWILTGQDWMLTGQDGMQTEQV